MKPINIVLHEPEIPQNTGNIARTCAATGAALHLYTEIRYPNPVFLFFGKETKGLPETFLHAHPDRCVRLPMREGLRSLNLSNSVAVGVYEVLRQGNFEGLQTAGTLTQFSWES